MGYGAETGSALADAAMRPGASRPSIQAELDAFAAPDNAPPEAIRAAIEAIAPVLLEADLEILRPVAMIAGALVERGCDPGNAADALAERLVRSSAGARPLIDAAGREVGPEGDDDDLIAARERLAASMPAATREWAVVDALLPAWIAMFGASPGARRRASDALPDLDRLAVANEGAHWLRRFLRILYDEPFLAIELATRSGIAGRMTGISDNFQLHVLLMDALPRPGLFAGRRVSKGVVAVANGGGPQQRDETVTGAWDLLDWRAAALDVAPDAGSPEWNRLVIWNEGMPADIPVFEAHRVVLLARPSYARTWNAMREFALPGVLSDVRRLSTADVNHLLARMRAAAGR